MSKSKWRVVECSICNGHGVVSAYSSVDFLGPKECSSCRGSGFVWISPKGRIADYPGGPFRGYATERELAEAKPWKGEVEQ